MQHTASYEITFILISAMNSYLTFKDSEGVFSRAYGQMGPFFLCLLLVSRARPFKDSEGGFSRAYGQMGPFLGRANQVSRTWTTRRRDERT
jgi:hypothetical protein